MIKKNKNQSGSIFFYILLGVVLFGALAFTISRGMRSQSTNSMSQRQIEIAANEILSISQSITRAIDRVRQNGYSETDLCFAQSSISDVNNSAYSSISTCNEDRAKLYHPEGGGLSFMPILAQWLEDAHAKDQGFGEWMFSNENAIEGLGVGDLSDAASVELIAHINHLKPEICEALNKNLGIIGIPDNGDAFNPTEPVSGPFAARGQINTPALSGQKAGCFKNTNTWDSYIFYTVLLERD